MYSWDKIAAANHVAPSVPAIATSDMKVPEWMSSIGLQNWHLAMVKSFEATAVDTMIALLFGLVKSR